MSAELPTSAARVQAALQRLGMPFQVVTMPSTTGTAQEAAAAIGCTVGQIAKSILFRGATTGKPILVVASGTNRVNESVVGSVAGEVLEKPKRAADFVREATGYVIGGVPPVGFPQPIATFIDEDLLQYETVWAAAGTPFSVFSLDPNALAVMTGGTVIRVV